MTLKASHPPLGSFIRPVPAALYCYQVIKVIPEDAESPECLFCKRFGYDPETQRPVQDGDQDIHYLNGLKQVMDGVWKDEWEFDTPRWTCVPLYWRKMHIDDVKTAGDSPAIQLSLL